MASASKWCLYIVFIIQFITSHSFPSRPRFTAILATFEEEPFEFVKNNSSIITRIVKLNNTYNDANITFEPGNYTQQEEFQVKTEGLAILLLELAGSFNGLASGAYYTLSWYIRQMFGNA